MTTTMMIKDVADATGFTAATLRYYEQIGLLPEARRTPAGYRTYDQRTLHRLAFIARAKQLGCSLHEITALSAAWNGGECGPIQDQLRSLVASKIIAAEQQMVELVTFVGELQQAAAALERHRPDGPCDAACGCVSDPHDQVPSDATAQSVVLSRKPPAVGEPAIVCTLSAGSLKERVADWNALFPHVVRRERIANGVRSVFDRDVPINELMRLVVAEQDCCQFLQCAITIDCRGLALEVRGPGAAQPIIESLFGLPS